GREDRAWPYHGPARDAAGGVRENPAQRRNRLTRRHHQQRRAGDVQARLRIRARRNRDPPRIPQTPRRCRARTRRQHRGREDGTERVTTDASAHPAAAWASGALTRALIWAMTRLSEACRGSGVAAARASV